MMIFINKSHKTKVIRWGNKCSHIESERWREVFLKEKRLLHGEVIFVYLVLIFQPRSFIAVKSLQ